MTHLEALTDLGQRYDCAKDGQRRLFGRALLAKFARTVTTEEALTAALDRYPENIRAAIADTVRVFWSRQS